MENKTELKWHQKTTPVILLLIFFFPVGLYLMWKNEMWSKSTRWIVTGVFAFAVIANANGNKSSNNDSSPTNNSQSQTNPCEDMDSYNKGFSYGRLERGGLPDCDTYYYEGAAANKDCWCKGFMEGRK